MDLSDRLEHEQNPERDNGRNHRQMRFAAPAATPMAAMTQMVAAGPFSPWMPASVRIMAPAPRKPMPVTIWAATRLVAAGARVGQLD